MPRAPKPAGPAPGQPQLREAAVRHLSRYAATEAGLVRVLDRRVQRWAVLAAAEGLETGPSVAEGRKAAREVARSLTQAGAIDDAAFAAARAARLARAGRSRRAVAAHLAAKGVGMELVRAALPDAEADFAAALAYASRRRIGPFREAPSAELRLRDLGALARAGFERDVAERALDTTRTSAEAAVAALRRG